MNKPPGEKPKTCEWHINLQNCIWRRPWRGMTIKSRTYKQRRRHETLMKSDAIFRPYGVRPHRSDRLTMEKSPNKSPPRFVAFSPHVIATPQNTWCCHATAMTSSYWPPCRDYNITTEYYTMRIEPKQPNPLNFVLCDKTFYNDMIFPNKRSSTIKSNF